MYIHIHGGVWKTEAMDQPVEDRTASRSWKGQGGTEPIRSLKIQHFRDKIKLDWCMCPIQFMFESRLDVYGGRNERFEAG